MMDVAEARLLHEQVLRQRMQWLIRVRLFPAIQRASVGRAYSIHATAERDARIRGGIDRTNSSVRLFNVLRLNSGFTVAAGHAPLQTPPVLIRTRVRIA